jgi:hypothetical protein
MIRMGPVRKLDVFEDEMRAAISLATEYDAAGPVLASRLVYRLLLFSGSAFPVCTMLDRYEAEFCRKKT